MEKPNDLRGINLMNRAAVHVMENFKDIALAYGDSDEYSFIFKKNTRLFNRRKDKITSCLVSLFSAAYTHFQKDYFTNIPS
jgi:tRNA(His) guanylyltransferase